VNLLKYLYIAFLSVIFSSQMVKAQGIEKPLTAAPASEYIKENSKEINCIALAVYKEALNQGKRGQVAVAHVIMNRMKSGKFPSTACGVVYQPHQFSFIHGRKSVPLPANADKNGILTLTRAVYHGEISDPTSGATYFYNPAIAHPRWGHAGKPMRIGAHMFIRA
jgi:N-acetylmuramoyl-L-alanine amidase